MKININNYEEFALDYLEGMLPAELKNEFMEFMADNPDIAAQIESLSGTMPVVVPDTRVFFDGKESLRKGRKIRPLLYYAGAAAALMVIGYVSFDLSRNENMVLPDTDVIAESITPKITVPDVETESVTEKVITGGTAPASEKRADVEPALTKKQPAGSVVTEAVQTKQNEPQIQEEQITQFEIITPMASDIQLALNTSAPGYDLSGGAIAADVKNTSSLVYIEFALPAVYDEGPAPFIKENVRDRKENSGFSIAALDALRDLKVLNPLRVYINEENERVVEFASIPISRRPIENDNDNIN